jgi:Tfp pilus assembly protein FimT
MRNDRRGFTALESAVTVVFLGVLASVATASVTPLVERWRLREAAQEIEQVLRRAQQYAIARDRTVYVSFNNPGAAAAGAVSRPTNQSYTLVVGDPCRPDDKNQRLNDLATSDRNALSITNQLPPQINLDLTTLNYGTCPTPVGTNDMPTTTNNANIVAFDYQGKLLQATNTDPSNAGKYIQMSTLRGNAARRCQIYTLTQLGDVGTVFQ